MRSTVTIISIHSKDVSDPKRSSNRVYSVEVRLDGENYEAEAILEEAFHLTNKDDRSWGRLVCSTSPGDILILNGDHYLVEGQGFHKLTPVQSIAVQQLTSRDTSMGMTWLMKHGHLS